MNQWSRRNFLKLGVAGLALPQFVDLRSQAAASRNSEVAQGFGRAKSCIVLFAWGGLSHLDTFDMKPYATSDVRGHFKEIPTAVPGIRVGEHVPGFARMMKEWAIVRSAHHNAPSHRSGAYWNLTGHEPPNLGGNWPASRDDWPCIGSLIWEALGDGRGPVPGASSLPYTLFDGGVANGQDGGFLGLGRDPVVLRPTGSKLREYGGKSPSSSEDEADAFKRFLASVAILAGTAVGSGCLAIPRATAPAGVIPSSAAMTLVWVFLCFSALCIVESVEATSRKMKREDVPLHVVAKQVRCLFSVFNSY